MSWKKNVFSFVLWFLYTIAVGTGVLGIAALWRVMNAFPVWIGLVAAGIWLAVAGLAVFLLCRIRKAAEIGWLKDSKNLPVVEGMLVVALVAAGIALRVYQISLDGGPGESIWLETAKVTEAQQIPQVVHGATYLYLQLLHGSFLLLGNKLTVAFGVQLVLQVLAGILLYLAVRRMAGRISGILMLAFLMLSSFGRDVLQLSPDALFLVCWAVGLCCVAWAMEKFERTRVPFAVTGLLIGLIGYLDITGWLLLLCLLGILGRKDKQQGIGRYFTALLLALVGSAAGLLTGLGLDAFGSGKPFENVFKAWIRLYQPSAFDLQTIISLEAVSMEAKVEGLLFLFLLTMGIFRYWCSRSEENQGIWIAVALALGTVQGLQMTVEQMDGSDLRFIILAILSAVALECIPLKAKEQEIDVDTTEETAALEVSETSAAIPALEEKEDTEQASDIQFLDNPLPVPKKHVAKVMDFKLTDISGDDFDHEVEEDDDFDY